MGRTMRMEEGTTEPFNTPPPSSTPPPPSPPLLYARPSQPPSTSSFRSYHVTLVFGGPWLLISCHRHRHNPHQCHLHLLHSLSMSSSFSSSSSSFASFVLRRRPSAPWSRTESPRWHLAPWFLMFNDHDHRPCHLHSRLLLLHPTSPSSAPPGPRPSWPPSPSAASPSSPSSPSYHARKIAMTSYIFRDDVIY